MAIVAMAAQALASGVFAADSTPTVAPPATWVVPHFFDRQSVAVQVESGADQHWLLLEQQVNAAENETFSHDVRQILTVSGVQDGANISIDFYPSYESLTLHWARIWRGTNHLDRLDASKVKVIRQERDLDQYQLNGEQSAVLVMDDVRVGDIVDYAYTLKGANPVFGGRFSSSVRAQLDQPVERLFTRVLWPSDRRLYAKPHGCSIQPAVASKKENTEYVWDLRQVPAFHVEDLLPVWCDPEPWVQLSEFKTWTEVNQWAMALFQTSASLSSEISNNVAGWKKIGGQEQQVLAVLRFIQDDVRYFGVEIGANAEKPTDPSTVFSRRFGDCKDKSLLFVTILRALGIEAFPVLVNTGLHRAIADWQPCADAFDHCIAVVECGGRAYWLDPTAGYQRGSLAEHYLPNYERGLVISPKTTALAVIPHETGLPLTTITEYFRLGRTAESSDLKVVTIAEGRDADDLRELLATTRRSETEKNYTHYYSDLYPGIKMSSPIEVSDDQQQNRIQTTEFYKIDRVWTQSEKDGKYRCEFYPNAIAALLKKPADTERTLPLGVPFPEHQILRTEVTLPEDWPADFENKVISDPAFQFRRNSLAHGNKIVMEYEYHALVDSIAPDAAPEHIRHVNQATQLLGYTISWP